MTLAAHSGDFQPISDISKGQTIDPSIICKAAITPASHRPLFNFLAPTTHPHPIPTPTPSVITLVSQQFLKAKRQIPPSLTLLGTQSITSMAQHPLTCRLLSEQALGGKHLPVKIRLLPRLSGKWWVLQGGSGVGGHEKPNLLMIWICASPTGQKDNIVAETELRKTAVFNPLNGSGISPVFFLGWGGGGVKHFVVLFLILVTFASSILKLFCLWLSLQLRGLWNISQQPWRSITRRAMTSMIMA